MTAPGYEPRAPRYRGPGAATGPRGLMGVAQGRALGDDAATQPGAVAPTGVLPRVNTTGRLGGPSNTAGAVPALDQTGTNGGNPGNTLQPGQDPMLPWSTPTDDPRMPGSGNLRALKAGPGPMDIPSVNTAQTTALTGRPATNTGTTAGGAGTTGSTTGGSTAAQPPATLPPAAPPVAAPAPAPAAAPAAAPAPRFTPMDQRIGQARQTEWDESQTAEGRLGRMLDSDSALMQRARARGAQLANRRGVLNTSMGMSASEGAMIDAAAPVALADSGQFFTTARGNTEQGNAWDIAALNRTSSDNQFGANLQLGYDKIASEEGMFGRKLASDEGMFGKRLAEDARQADLGSSTQLKIAGMNFDIQDRRLTMEDKQFVQKMALEQRTLDTQIDQFAKKFGLEKEQVFNQKQQFYDQLSQQDRQFLSELGFKKDQLAQQADQFNTEWANRFSLEKMAQANRIDLANLDANTRRELSATEAAWRKEIAGNETVSNAWGTMLQEIGRVQNNPDLDAGAKLTLINNYTDSFNSFANYMKKASGGRLDVSDLLLFKPAAPASTSDPTTAGARRDGEVVDAQPGAP